MVKKPGVELAGNNKNLGDMPHSVTMISFSPPFVVCVLLVDPRFQRK
jgi:hypothetical protein